MRRFFHLCATYFIVASFLSKFAEGTVGSAPIVNVSTAFDLAEAFADPGIGTAIIVATRITLSVEAFDALQRPLPLTLDRDFAIVGSETLPLWPWLDLAFVRSKVRLASGRTLTFRRVVLDNARDGSQSRSQGIDLLSPPKGALPPPPSPAQPPSPALSNTTATNASATNATAGPLSLVLMEDMAFTNVLCLSINTTGFSARSIPRTPLIPGTQQANISVGSQPNCTNATDASLLAMQRCWPNVNLYIDHAGPATDADALGALVPSGYYMRLLGVYELCARMMPQACVDRYGGFGCFTQLYAGKGRVLPYADAGAGATPSPSGVPAIGNATSAPEAPQPTGPPVGVGGGGERPDAAGGGGGSRRRQVLGPVLGGVLGGVALVALAAAAFLVWNVRRRRAMESSAASASPPPGPAKKAYSSAPVSADSVRLEPRSAASALGGSTDDAQADTTGSWSAGGSAATGPGARAAGAAADTTLVAVTAFTPVRPEAKLPSPPEVTLLPVALGAGGFGRVVEGVFQGQRVAVKLLQVPVDPARGGTAGGTRSRSTLDEAGALAREVEVLGRCDHPNVVRLLAACLGPPRPCLVMELMETSLDGLLYGGGGGSTGAGAGAGGKAGKRGGGAEAGGRPALLPLPKVLYIAREVARGLAYLHPTVMHRDLKPANVLLSDAHSPQPVVKLADFGLSRLRQSTRATRHPEAGTPPFMAPECFEVSNNIITHDADIFSFGCVLWCMLTGEQPWARAGMVAIATQVTLLRRRLPLSKMSEERCPRQLRALLVQCFDHDPRRRPAAAEVVKRLELIREALALKAAEQAAAGQLPV